MLWKNKVLELVIEGNEKSKALGKKAGRDLAIARGIDITKEEELPRYKELQAKALEKIRKGFRAARNKSQIGENKKRKAARKANSKYLADKATAENKTRTDAHNEVIAALAGTGTDPTQPEVDIMIRGTLSTARNDPDKVEQARRAAIAIGSNPEGDLTQNQANKKARATYKGTAPDAPIIKDALRTKKGS